MTIFRVAYKPVINDRVIQHLIETYDPAMIEYDDNGVQFSIDDVIESYQDLGIEDSILNELRKEKIDYVEF